MTTEIHVPDIGADDVNVTEILVKVGDTIKQEQSLITVEGDKAAMEVPAAQAGVVKAIHVKVGDTVKTGSLIMEFEAEGESTAPAATESAPEKPAAKTEESTATEESVAETETTTAAVQEVHIPDIGGDAVEVTAVMVAVGDTVQAEQSILTVEGDKAAMEVPAPFSGKVTEIKVATGDKVSTGTLVMLFETAGSPAAVTEKPAATTTKAEVKAEVVAETKPAPVATAAETEQTDITANAAYAHASPVVRRLAREFGVDLSKVKGSGRKNRVLKEDVQNYVKQLLQQVAAGKTSTGSGVGLDLLPWPKVDFSRFGEVEEKPLSRIQKISGQNLHRNWVMIPHVTQFDEADITDLEDFRKSQNALAEKKKLGVKYTPLVFIMKAVAKALEEFPTFNSSLSEDGQSLVLKKYVHLGIAVDTPNGLVVPVVRDVNKKGIIELSRELTIISAKAREGKLTAADMQGGSFTISSLGGIGGTAFTPIVNAPEVAILGVSKSDIKPKWNGKEFAPKLMLPLSVSYDHRVIDGALAARFTATLSEYLSDIRQIIM